MVHSLKIIVVSVLVGSVYCAAQLALKPAVETDNVPTIEDQYLIFKPAENEFRDETPEQAKTIPAGFHNPTLVVSPESRKNIDDKMEKVGKGLCYASIATFILSGGGDTRLCGY
ncbi:hypothetical protein [Fibrobacter sp. UWB11]|uniref:hypothetical protein n=1 Tax=Fibrobacter sp. UWB11 TaxID=1896202 RepID=UPI00092A6352|nr:hypothetical protein [Fibrobacter sp. UWB11]SIN92503.1 hypothetical protein SAMN05720758_0605 [Fibrobacter sp. UWB11]